MSDLTSILQAAASDRQRPEELLPLVYDDLRRLASARMARENSAHTLQPTALVHEAWLRLCGDGTWAWENRAHFFGAAAEAMRRILIESARRKASLKHGGGWRRLEIEAVEIADVAPEDQLLRINEALAQMETENPERAQVVLLKFFGRLSNKEIADTIGLSERTVNRHWLCAKTWLFLKLKNAD